MAELPDKVVIDAEKLTLGDLEEVEELSGMSFSALQNNPGGVPLKALRALAFVTVRKTHPDVTFEDCKGFKQGSIVNAGEDGAADPPQSPEGDGGQ